MSDHPYPDYIRQAVATTIARQVLVMRSWSDLTKQTRDAFLTDADEVLQALWDASRVDSVEQLEALPENAIVHDGYFSYEKDVYAWRGGGVPYYITHDEMDLPMNIIYWGDTDE